jgi:hypothetical protein
MVSPLFYSPLAVLAIVWLFVMWHVAGSRRGAPRPPPATPSKPTRPRSTEPQAFAGLTHKPPCARWARDPPQPQPPSPVSPDPLAPTTRRPRAIDTSQPCWPYADGADGGWLGRGTRRAHGQPSGGPWRQGHGTSCTGSFLETPGPRCHGQQAAGALIGRVVACLAAG